MNKVKYLVNSPINNRYLSNAFGMTHDACFTEHAAYTVDVHTLNPKIMTYDTRGKAYDMAKEQGHLHGFEPIVVKIVIQAKPESEKSTSK